MPTVNSSPAKSWPPASNSTIPWTQRRSATASAGASQSFSVGPARLQRATLFSRSPVASCSLADGWLAEEWLGESRGGRQGDIFHGEAAAERVDDGSHGFPPRCDLVRPEQG